MSTWLLVWVLLTPGGDVMDQGTERFTGRQECNMERQIIEQRRYSMGQKIQAVCFEVVHRSK